MSLFTRSGSGTPDRRDRNLPSKLTRVVFFLCKINMKTKKTYHQLRHVFVKTGTWVRIGQTVYHQLLLPLCRWYILGNRLTAERKTLSTERRRPRGSLRAGERQRQGVRRPPGVLAALRTDNNTSEEGRGFRCVFIMLLLSLFLTVVVIFGFVFHCCSFLGLAEIRFVTVAVDFFIAKEKTRGITKLKSIK